jgi:hypothetical protein
VASASQAFTAKNMPHWSFQTLTAQGWLASGELNVFRLTAFSVYGLQKRTK